MVALPFKPLLGAFNESALGRRVSPAGVLSSHRLPKFKLRRDLWDSLLFFERGCFVWKMRNADRTVPCSNEII